MATASVLAFSLPSPRPTADLITPPLNHFRPYWAEMALVLLSLSILRPFSHQTFPSGQEGWQDGGLVGLDSLWLSKVRALDRPAFFAFHFQGRVYKGDGFVRA